MSFDHVRKGLACAVLFVMGTVGGLAFRASETEPARTPTADSEPAPSQDTIDFLASIDPRTLQPHVPETEKVHYDLAGRPVPFGVRSFLGSMNADHSQTGCTDHIALSPDSKQVALSSCSGSMTVYDLETGRRLLKWHVERGDLALAIAFTPDNKLLVAFSHYVMQRLMPLTLTLAVVDLKSGEETTTSLGELGATAAAFSEDRSLIAVCGQVLEVREVAGGAVRGSFRLNSCVRNVAFTPDGKQLAIHTAMGHAGLVDWATGEGAKALSQPKPLLGGLDLSNYGQAERHGPMPLEPHFIDAAELPLKLVMLTDRPQVVAVSPDGRTLAAAGKNDEALWEISTGLKRREFPSHVSLHVFVFTPDGHTLIRNQPGGALVLDLTQPPPKADPAAPVDLAKLWDQLEDPIEGEAAYDAVLTLTAMPKEAVPFLLRQSLRGPPSPSPEEIRKLIADLDAPQFAVREEAVATLARMGRNARPAVMEARAGRPGLELLKRLDQLLERIVAAESTPDHLGSRRAIEVLERIGTVEARDALKELSRKALDDAAKADARASEARISRQLEAH